MLNRKLSLRFPNTGDVPLAFYCHGNQQDYPHLRCTKRADLSFWRFSPLLASELAIFPLKLSVRPQDHLICLSSKENVTRPQLASLQGLASNWPKIEVKQGKKNAKRTNGSTFTRPQGEYSLQRPLILPKFTCQLNTSKRSSAINFPTSFSGASEDGDHGRKGTRAAR